ncbi:Hypothetical protein CINCED_3A014640 [Cinara cedri]|uniref:Reverse transcriptase domain n=1 Tax=Cinara cedri TaxID=506608 RepID=A0A5E4N112_9HEMI|nr:Hypothetical protein CINCED_3A014640 [Cinara cedri]
MNLMLNTLASIMDKFHMKINTTKTKTMAARRNQIYTQPSIKQNNIELLRGKDLEDIQEHHTSKSQTSHGCQILFTVEKRGKQQRQSYHDKALPLDDDNDSI